MCLILIAYEEHPESRLIIAANRDEFMDRPTLAMHPWQNDSKIVAGRDIKAGGTWLGMTQSGRFAALTNFRDPGSIKENAPSRGSIVTDFLESSLDAATFLNKFNSGAEKFNGFNLLAGDENSLYWFSNIKGRITKLSPGFHGLSNHLLNTPWPKVTRGKRALKELLTRKEAITTEAIFPLLKDRTQPSDNELPDTGVGKKKERLLAPIFIKSPTYGTRCSTALIITRDGTINLCERTYGQTYGQYDKQEENEEHKERCFTWHTNQNGLTTALKQSKHQGAF